MRSFLIRCLILPIYLSYGQAHKTTSVRFLLPDHFKLAVPLKSNK